MILRQATSQAIRFGPFLNDTDGVTPETGLTIAQADMQISKDGAVFAQKNAVGNATHDADGWYSTTLDTTDTGTVGEFLMQVNVTGALPVWVRYWVVEEGIYDGFYGASAAGFDASGYVAGIQGTLNTLDALDTAQDSQHSTTQAAIATVDNNVDAILVDTAELQGDWTNGGRLDLILDELTTQGDTNEAAIGALNDITAADVWAAGTRTLTANTNLNDPTAAAIADAVWDEAKAGHVAAGSFGEEVQAHALSSEVDALNDIDSTAVQTAAAAALTAYDPPTRAELTSDIGTVTTAISGLNDFDPANDTVATVTTVTSVTNQVTANVTAISGSTTAADKLEASALTIITGAAATGTLSTTQMTTNLGEATDDHYNGRIIIWTSGVLTGQATDITDYAGTGGLLTYTAITEAPSNGDTFIII